MSTLPIPVKLKSCVSNAIEVAAVKVPPNLISPADSVRPLLAVVLPTAVINWDTLT